jgi:uncharacterized protein DUF6345
MANTLAIYRLRSEDSGVAHHVELASKIFDLQGNFKLSVGNGNRVLHEGGRYTVEVTPSGGVWAVDETQLWNPAIRPVLPKEGDELKNAEEFLRRQQLLPRLEMPFRYGKPVVGGTYFALMQEKGKRENRQLDAQVVYPVQIGDIPVVGGGGDFTVIFGDQSRVIGFTGGWRPISGFFEAKVIERNVADEQFRAMTKGLKIESFDAELAYYAAPHFKNQEFLYPVYVYRAVARFEKQRVPLRQIMLPATEFGPPVVFGERQPPREKRARPIFSGTEKDKVQRRGLAARSPWRPWEAGTSWIGQSGGLAGSQANAQGFVDEWAAAGWHIDFNWGDANAWESDWRRNDDTWVDNADFVFYTGHANKDGWVLSKPDDGFLSFSEVGANP